MELDNGVKARFPAFNGQKSSLVEALSTRADCEKILNFVTRRGRLRKIWGTTLYANPDLVGAAGRSSWLAYFKERWLFQQGHVIGIETAEGSQAFQKLGEIQGEGGVVRSERWLDRLYLTNGFENKFVEKLDAAADTFLNLGLYPPGLGRRAGRFINPATGFLTATPDGYAYAAFAELSSIGGGSLANDVYYYRVTWFDSERGIESLPDGSEVNEDGLWEYAATVGNGILVSSGGAGQVRVDITKLKAIGYDPRVTHFRVYRATQADPNVYKCVNMLGTVLGAGGPNGTPIASDFFDDNVAEADLGQVLDFSISPPPSGRYNVLGGPEDTLGDYGPRFVKLFRDQLWLFGVRLPGSTYGVEAFETTPGAGAGSIEAYRTARLYPQSGIAYGSDVANFDHWKYTYGIGRASGQKDTGMEKFGDTLMFFKEKSAFYLTGTSPENYEIREMDPERGFTVPGSVFATTLGVIGIGQGGFTLFDGVSRGKIISEEIADEVERINLAYADKIHATFDPEEEKYECHVPVDGATYNNMVFVYDLKSRSWNFTKRAGGAAAYAINSSKRTVGLIGDKQNGRLYLATDRSAVTFAGQTMHGIWRSRQEDFDLADELKNLQYVTILARAKRDFRLTVEVVVDMGQRDAVKVADIDPDVRESAWAEDENDAEGSRWGEAQWSAGVVRKTFTVLTPCIGEKFQLILRNSDTDADAARFEIEEVVMVASRMDGSDD